MKVREVWDSEESVAEGKLDSAVPAAETWGLRMGLDGGQHAQKWRKEIRKHTS